MLSKVSSLSGNQHQVSRILNRFRNPNKNIQKTKFSLSLKHLLPSLFPCVSRLFIVSTACHTLQLCDVLVDCYSLSVAFVLVFFRVYLSHTPFCHPSHDDIHSHVQPLAHTPTSKL